MKSVKAADGGAVFCDNCEAAATLAVELRDGSRLCAECVQMAAELVRDADAKRG